MVMLTFQFIGSTFMIVLFRPQIHWWPGKSNILRVNRPVYASKFREIISSQQKSVELRASDTSCRTARVGEHDFWPSATVDQSS